MPRKKDHKGAKPQPGEVVREIAESDLKATPVDVRGEPRFRDVAGPLAPAPERLTAPTGAPGAVAPEPMLLPEVREEGGSFPIGKVLGLTALAGAFGVAAAKGGEDFFSGLSSTLTRTGPRMLESIIESRKPDPRVMSALVQIGLTSKDSKVQVAAMRQLGVMYNPLFDRFADILQKDIETGEKRFDEIMKALHTGGASGVAETVTKYPDEAQELLGERGLAEILTDLYLGGGPLTAEDRRLAVSGDIKLGRGEVPTDEELAAHERGVTRGWIRPGMTGVRREKIPGLEVEEEDTKRRYAQFKGDWEAFIKTGKYEVDQVNMGILADRMGERLLTDLQEDLTSQYGDASVISDGRLGLELMRSYDPATQERGAEILMPAYMKAKRMGLPTRFFTEGLPTGLTMQDISDIQAAKDRVAAAQAKKEEPSKADRDLVAYGFTKGYKAVASTQELDVDAAEDARVYGEALEAALTYAQAGAEPAEYQGAMEQYFERFEKPFDQSRINSLVGSIATHRRGMLNFLARNARQAMMEIEWGIEEEIQDAADNYKDRTGEEMPVEAIRTLRARRLSEEWDELMAQFGGAARGPGAYDTGLGVTEGGIPELSPEDADRLERLQEAYDKPLDELTEEDIDAILGAPPSFGRGRQ